MILNWLNGIWILQQPWMHDHWERTTDSNYLFNGYKL